VAILRGKNRRHEQAQVHDLANGVGLCEAHGGLEAEPSGVQLGAEGHFYTKRVAES